MYNNEQIDNLMISKIAIVNSGNITIDSSDVPIASPLYINVRDDCRILSANVLEQSNTSSLVNVTLNSPSSINIKFDYLDKKDGAVVQVIHTGNKSQFAYSGKLKGGRIITPANENDSKRIKFWKQFTYTMLDQFKKTAFIFLLIFFLFLFVLVLFPHSFGISIASSANGFQIQMNRLYFIVMMFSLTSSIVFSFISGSMPIMPRCLRKYFKY
jgi:hypothetical protein